MSLKHKTISGVIWNFSELMLRRGMSGLTTLILAWFLVPQDFGLLAMMTVFLSLSTVLVDAGFSQAIIRKQTLTERELNTAFYSNICISLLTYMGLFFCAPLIAAFYQQPELEALIQVAGLAILFNAITMVQQALLNRSLKFKLLLQISLPAAFLSGLLAILLAYYGAGVWALIAQVISSAFFTMLFYWRLKIWRPVLQFGWSEFRELFSFGGFLLLEQLSRVPFKNMYVIVIAKIYSSSIAGLYFFADKIRDLLLQQLVASVEKVTYPALSQVNNDIKKLKNGYRQIISLTTFLVFPVLIFFAALVDVVFELLLPEAWSPASQYLQLMCLASLMNPINALNLNILKVKGRSDLFFYLGIIKKVTAIVIFLITYQYGIKAIIFGQIINSVLGYIPNSYYSKKLVEYSVKEQLKDFIPALSLAGLIGYCLWLAQKSLEWSPFIELILIGSCGVLVYVLGAFLLRIKALEEVFVIVRSMLQSKFGRNVTR